MSIKIIAEIGINHNGDMDIAKKLIDVAAWLIVTSLSFKEESEICVPENKNIKKSQLLEEI